MRLRRAKSFVWLVNLENLRNKDKERCCSPVALSVFPSLVHPVQER